MRAILFPGQGSQFVGMGSDFYNEFESVKRNFEIVDNTLGYSLSKIILSGPDADLNLTKNTQPAIMTIGVSIFNVLNKEYNFNLKKSEFFAGHSLGEYTALVCAGSLTIERAAYLLHERGKAMQNAVPAGQGSMIAVLGMTMTEVEKEVSIVNKIEVCEIANDNSDFQIVVSGTKKAIEILNENLRKKKKKGIILSVSAPFHSSLMKKASENMKDKLEKTNFLTPQPRVISNVTSKEYESNDNIKVLLVDQIMSRVRWRESVNYMIRKGVDEFIEIGPGKALSGLVKKINSNVKISNVNYINNIKE